MNIGVTHSPLSIGRTILTRSPRNCVAAGPQMYN